MGKAVGQQGLRGIPSLGGSGMPVNVDLIGSRNIRPHQRFLLPVSRVPILVATYLRKPEGTGRGKSLCGSEMPNHAP